MRAKIDMDGLWRRAVGQADLDLAEQEREAARARVRDALDVADCPISLDDLCGETMRAEALAALIQVAVTRRTAIEPG
jgi:hypothetical protein